VSDGVRREFAGWYRSVSPRQQHLYFLERLGGMTRVTFRGDTMRMQGLGEAPIGYVAVDSMRFRRPGESVATVAFFRDAANDRPQALERGLDAMKRVGNAQAITEMGLAAAWMVAVLVGLLALVFGVIRWVTRRIRTRNPPPSPARPLWRAAIFASLMILVFFVTVAASGASIRQLGTLTMVSGTLYAAGWLFAAWAVIGFLLVLVRRKSSGRWTWLSVWTARALLLLHVVAAAYFVYWGPVGWKTWG
jgi:hypothetical protein